MTDAIVVGAGLAGLAAAYEARRAGAGVLVLEGERRAGGVVVTEAVAEGWVVEGGPDSFLAADGTVLALAAELGIAGRILQQSAHGSALWTGTELKALSEGEAAALLGIQAKPEDMNAGHRTFAGGMGELIDALAAEVRPALRFGVGVSGIAPANGGFRLSTTGGAVLTAETVILALPSWRAAQLLGALAPDAANTLAAIRYFPSTTVSLGYRADQIGAPLQGTGFVVKAEAGIPLRACTYASAKFAGRAPAGHALLRAFLAPVSAPAATVARDTLASILRISGEPLWTRSYEWPRGIPFYAPDHQTRLSEARRRLAGLGNLALAGAGYDGAGVGACLRSGMEAARGVLQMSNVQYRISNVEV
jgi:oxygen-dependent protoporphyrinogen oxidase